MWLSSTRNEHHFRKSIYEDCFHISIILRVDPLTILLPKKISLLDVLHFSSNLIIIVRVNCVEISGVLLMQIVLSGRGSYDC